MTSGPQVNPDAAVNVGVAAHITAAAPGGPRYDESLTPQERSDTTNAIWLCQICAKLVDNDEVRFPVDTLRKWKEEAELQAIREIGKPATHHWPKGMGLFEARYSIYEAVHSFESHASCLGCSSTAEWNQVLKWLGRSLSDLPGLGRRAKFLMGDDVSDHIGRVHRKGWELFATFARYQTSMNYVPSPELINAQRWFIEQAPGETDQVFARYLKYS